MEELCEKLHPSIYIDQTCLQWFTEAIDHCSDLVMFSSVSVGTQFLRRFKNFLLPTRTPTIWDKTPVFLHPQHLSPSDCQSLFLDIAKDYIKRTPTSSSNTVIGDMFGSVLVLFSAVLFLAICILKMQQCCKRWWAGSGQRQDLKKTLSAQSQMERRMLWVNNRNMSMMKTELKQLHLCDLVQAEHLLPRDGSATLVLKMHSKLQLFNDIVHGGLQSSGCLYLSPKECHKDKMATVASDLKTVKVTQAVNLLNNYSHKLHLLIVFDEDASYEEVLLNTVNNVKLPSEKSVVAPSEMRCGDGSAVKSSQAIISNQRGGNPLFRRTSSTTFPLKSVPSVILRGATTLQLTAAQHSSILRRRKASSQSTTPREKTTSEQQSPLGYSSSLWQAKAAAAALLSSPRAISKTYKWSIPPDSPISPQTKTTLESIISPRSIISSQVRSSFIPAKTTPQRQRTSLPSKLIMPTQDKSSMQSKVINLSDTAPQSARAPMSVNSSPRSIRNILQANINQKTTTTTTTARTKTIMKVLPASQIPSTLQTKRIRTRSEQSDQSTIKPQTDYQESHLRSPSTLTRSSALPRPSLTSLATSLLRTTSSKTSISK